MQQNSWFSGIVLRGDQLGRTIGFPTLNLDPQVLKELTLERGVYSAEVKVLGKTYVGALYYGPRRVLDEVHDVLEIFVLDFDQEVYGQEVSWRFKNFVRDIIEFKSFEELKSQLKLDVEAVR